MEQNHLPTSPDASAARLALAPAHRSTQIETPDPTPRRLRHDGWTPERQVVFLETLAATGVVADACRQAGLSCQGAYAFRNRRAGRAFATAWEAVLVHRARGRLGDEVMSRAINGVIETLRDQNGEVRGERHRYDNRLSMAVLTRLDRLAERTGDRDALLRAVSEDLDDFLDCVEAGEDADAFIDARRPPPDPASPREHRFVDIEGNQHPCLWAEEDGSLRTNFPPPAGFTGLEEGRYDGMNLYARTLTPREQAVVEADIAAMAGAEVRERDRYFRFGGGLSAAAREVLARWLPSPTEPAPAAPDPDPARQASTSSTSPPPTAIAPDLDPTDRDAR